MIHDTVLFITLILMGVVLAAFCYVAVNAGRTGPEYGDIQARSYSVRARFFWSLVIAGVVITAITTVDLPFAATRGDVDGADKIIAVEGGQWYWKLNESTARVGETVVFNVTTPDVSHGFGVYDPQLRLIGQTQVMPGYTNALKLTFDTAGTYKLLCMEYCGLAHHGMIADFTIEL